MIASNNSTLHQFATTIYHPENPLAYVFIINVVTSGMCVLLLYKEFLNFRFSIDSVLYKSIIIYSLPLLVAGLAGMINETLDRIILNFLVINPQDALHQQGIYGACYKLSILMTLGIQMFRYAAEPFFFSRMKDADGKQVYAQVMKYFVAACCIVFLLVVLYLDIFKYFIGKSYWEGLHVVPILLMANLCLGVYINQSMWYKLSGQTKYGMWFSLMGAVITIGLNLILIPNMGYTGAAWTTLVCYASMMIVSYLVGQRFYPIDYELKTILSFIFVSLILVILSAFFQMKFNPSNIFKIEINTIFFLAFIYFVVKALKFF